MSQRCPNPRGSLRPTAPATLWAGRHCVGCPASQVCVAARTDDACGHPSQYPSSVLHPASLRSQAKPSDFHLRPFASPDTTFLLPRPHLLTISDGSLTGTVRLKEVLAAVRRTSTGADHLGRLAVLHGRDRDLIRLIRERGRLGRRLFDIGFIGAISPSYSTWADHPPWESLMSEALTAAIATEIDQHLPTIPSIVWRAHEELDRWASWIIDSNRRAIALHSGPLRQDSEWAWWLLGIERLRSHFSDTAMPHLYVNGPSTKPRLADVIDIWGTQVTFLTQHPFIAAVRHNVLDEAFIRTPDLDDRPPKQLLAANHERVARFLRNEFARRPQAA